MVSNAMVRSGSRLGDSNGVDPGRARRRLLSSVLVLPLIAGVIAALSGLHCAGYPTQFGLKLIQSSVPTR